MSNMFLALLPLTSFRRLTTGYSNGATILSRNSKTPISLLKTIFLVVSISILFSSCSSFYGVGNFSSESTILQKPTYRDSTAEATYISGSYHHIINSNDFDEYDKIELGTLSFSKGYTEEKQSYAFGGFLHAGNYQAQALRNIQGTNQVFYGGGVTGEFSFNFNHKHFDVRLPGVKLTALYESGSYADFRREAESRSESDFFGTESIVNLNRDNFSLNLSAISEIVYKHRKVDIGYRLSIGTGHQIITIGHGLFFTSKNVTGFVQMSAAIQGTYIGSGLALQLN